MDGYYDYHPQVQLHRPLVLVGIATEPARRLGHWLSATEGLPFVDIDRCIEHKAGASLFELVAQQGESRYREMERDALTSALRAQPAGIIVGGDGLVLDAENRDTLKERCHWVALTATAYLVARIVQRNLDAVTGFWHPTKREVLMSETQVDGFTDVRVQAMKDAAAIIRLDDHDRRSLRQRVRQELPLAA